MTKTVAEKARGGFRQKTKYTQLRLMECSIPNRPRASAKPRANSPTCMSSSPDSSKTLRGAHTHKLEGPADVLAHAYRVVRLLPRGSRFTCSSLFWGVEFPDGYDPRRLGGVMDEVVRVGLARRTGETIAAPRLKGNPGYAAEYEVVR